MHNIVKILLVISILLVVYFIWFQSRTSPSDTKNVQQVNQDLQKNPLGISEMRKRQYPGSDLIIEQTLQNGSNYHQYIASYFSDDLKIYGLLTVPIGEKPADGWPVIIFNHGYIAPEEYRTTERYADYVDGFARGGYMVYKSDYRGNGSSEGKPEGAYYSPAYTVDVLNALSSLKKYPDADASKIGMWGHSLGGNITLRGLVISPDIKAAVIWAGVVGTYDDLMNSWQRRVPFRPSPSELTLRNRSRSDLIAKYGTPQQNPNFWNSIDPNYNLQYVQAPVQLHAGLSDEEVPWQFSQGLYNRLKEAGKFVEFYTYQGADHNISGPSFSLAIQRSVDFFNKYLKGGE